MIWLFIIVLIDSIGFGIILPLLPILAITLNMSAFDLGMIVSSFAFAQFLFAPILGILSDKLGRKIIIIICLLSIAISYHLLAISTTFYHILFARIISGIFTGNISIVMASASDLSSEKNRAKYMGYIGAALGIGFILGPIIGGLLAGSDFKLKDLEFVFNIAGIFTFVAGILSIFFLKESLTKDIKNKSSVFFLTEIKSTLKNIIADKKIMFLIYLSTLTWFSFSSIQVFLSSWSVAKFDFNPLELGIIGTTFAFIFALIQITLTKFLYGTKALLLGFIICLISILAMLINPNIMRLTILVLGLAVGLGILFPNLNSSISLYGTDRQKGFILGLSQSAGTLGQSFGPIIVGFAYTNININTAWIFIALGFLISIIITLQYKFLQKQ
jgi:MFS family permease